MLKEIASERAEIILSSNSNSNALARTEVKEMPLKLVICKGSLPFPLVDWNNGAWKE